MAAVWSGHPNRPEEQNALTVDRSEHALGENVDSVDSACLRLGAMR